MQARVLALVFFASQSRSRGLEDIFQGMSLENLLKTGLVSQGKKIYLDYCMGTKSRINVNYVSITGNYME